MCISNAIENLKFRTSGKFVRCSAEIRCTFMPVSCVAITCHVCAPTSNYLLGRKWEKGYNWWLPVNSETALIIVNRGQGTRVEV
jgi:hypothetical protein